MGDRTVLHIRKFASFIITLLVVALAHVLYQEVGAEFALLLFVATTCWRYMTTVDVHIHLTGTGPTTPPVDPKSGTPLT